MYVHKNGFCEHAFQLFTLHCNSKESKVMPKVEKIVCFGAFQVALVQINFSGHASQCFRWDLILGLTGNSSIS